MTTEKAIFEACLLRFRPILDDHHGRIIWRTAACFWNRNRLGTTASLGITIVGGLIVSQMLTLYTTPVIYLLLDRLRLKMSGGQRQPTFAMAGGSK